MTPNDEVLVDELRFGRMFQRLQRAGMYRRCGCAGCAPCAESAQRLLRGVAQGGRFSGYYRPERWGDRYRVYERPTQSGTVSVLTDTVDRPTVVDVNVDLSGDDAPQEEFSLGYVLKRKAPVDVHDLIEQVSRKAALRFHEVSQLERVSDAPGLYVIQWPGGQYLGKADNMRKRLLEHRALMYRYGVKLNKSNSKWFVALTKGVSPQTKEHQILKDLADAAGKLKNLKVGKDTYATLFRHLGMTNQRTELEWF